VPEPDAGKAQAKIQGKTLSLYANQSILIDSAQDIKRVAIARPETADVLVVNGDPLRNLAVLTDVRLVIHLGEIIRRN
jgi:hypothetical protein